jgi:hypothetical protein
MDHREWLNQLLYAAQPVAYSDDKDDMVVQGSGLVSVMLCYICKAYPFPILRRNSSDSMIFLFCSDVGRRPTRFLLRLFASCRSLSDTFPHVVLSLANR